MSRLSDFLRRVVSYADDLKVENWATILAVEPRTIEDWLADRTAPSAFNLGSLVDTLREDTRAAKLVAEWEELAALPVAQVTKCYVPHYEEPGEPPTLGHYCVHSILDSFMRTFATVPPDVQEQVLYEAVVHLLALKREVDGITRLPPRLRTAPGQPRIVICEHGMYFEGMCRRCPEGVK